MFYKRISDLRPMGTPSGGTNWNNIEPISVESTSGSSESAITTKKAKSLWFEVAISKDKNNKPVGNPEKIAKFERKRLNAYLFLEAVRNIPNQIVADSTNIDAELEIANNMVIRNLYTSYLPIKESQTTISSVSTTAVTANNNFTTNNAQCATISADTINSLNNGNITYVSGNTFLLENYDFEHVFAANIHSNAGRFDKVKATELSSETATFTEISIKNLIYNSMTLYSGFSANNDNVCEWFKINSSMAESEYSEGTLIRFGRSDDSSADWEITIANGNDHIANGIIANTNSNGLILNKQLHGLASKPVVLMGRAKVRVKQIGSTNTIINKGQKLYLHTVENGIAGIQQNGSPIGIALESKTLNYNSEQLIDCLVKFNID